MKKDIATFQFITQNHPEYSHVKQARLVCEAGGKWIQYRNKTEDKELKLEEARQIRDITRSFGATMIVNDDVNLAKMVQADGVHLGQEDMSVQRARMMLGKKVIVGKTCNTLNQINSINLSHVDYIGLGPFRATKTKNNLSPILGIEGFEQILNQRLNAIPVVGIGGVLLKDVASLMATGLDGIAVSGAVLNNNLDHTVKGFLDQSKLKL